MNGIVIVGAGQTPGATIGNGRATAILFAREGARVLLVEDNAINRKLGIILLEKLGLESGPANLDDWREVVDRMENTRHEVTVAMIGKYVNHADAYKSLNEALASGGAVVEHGLTQGPGDEARLAREAAGETIWVAGSVGPSGADGARILGPGSREVKDAFAEQIDALVEGGVDDPGGERSTHYRRAPATGSPARVAS